MSFSIAGKTAIITGSANGIGLAIARHFLEHGANVVLADMDEDRLREAVDWDSEEGQNARFFAGDLRQKLTVANLLSATIDAFDRVDILVNGARQMLTTDPLDPEDASVSTLMEQNVMASLQLSQLIARRMVKQAEDDDQEEGQVGAIVNLSSITSRQTHPELLALSMSAAAMDQMTRSLALALAPQRIRVNAVAIGSVMSASLRRALKDSDEMRRDIVDHTPLGRVARSSEVAEAVHYLSADASSFVTGQILTVDGGRSLLDPVSLPAH